MAIVYTDEQNYIDIANSIRTKNGETRTYRPDQMADAILDIETRVDITLDNPASGSDLRSGKQLIDANYNIIDGSVPSRSSSDVVANENVVSIPAGIYDSDVSKSINIVEQATPNISVDTNGLITASAEQSAGYVSSGTKSATKQLTTKTAATITPSTSNQTIDAGTYLTGIQTILGDENLKKENIKNGVSIFGIHGSLIADGESVSYPTLDDPGTASDLIVGKQLIDSNGNIVTGTMIHVAHEIPEISVGSDGLIIATSHQNTGYITGGTQVSRYQLDTLEEGIEILPSTGDIIVGYFGAYMLGNITVLGDGNLQSENIKDGVTIFGVEGSLTTESEGVSLPTLTSQGEASDLVYGKQLIDSNGNIVTGTLSNAEEAKFGV